MTLLSRARSHLKAGIERSLRATLERRTAGGAMRGRRLILAYHGVRPKEDLPAGEHTLHIDEARLEEELDALAELTRVVPLAALMQAEPSEDPRPLVAITWDDAYAGAMTLGVEALVRRGLPATIFVAPGRLGQQTFWWDRVAQRHGGTVPAQLRERILADLAGDEARVETEVERNVPVDLPEWAVTASESCLVAAARRSGITLGAHSWSHVNLSAVDTRRLEEELRCPLEWLRKKTAPARAWLSLPYGLGSPEVRGKAVNAGYLAVFNIRGGWVPAGGAEAAAMPRFNVPAGLSIDGFVLRLAGLFCR